MVFLRLQVLAEQTSTRLNGKTKRTLVNHGSMLRRFRFWTGGPSPYRIAL
ncbi:hypothetical protein Hdeb2414_s0190g00827981 [Helianthus debilis subsp. tardiflorus]